MKHPRAARQMPLAVFLCLLLLLPACTPAAPEPAPPSITRAEEVPSADKLAVEPSIRILHAGGAYNGMTYLNAQEAFAPYYEAGYRYFEYDLMLSSDGRLIGTHGYQHLAIPEEPLTYEVFNTLRLPGGLTPVNEDWLIETVRTHPDIRIVVDAKMDTTEGDVAVLARIEALEAIHGIDLSPVIIPEIFSVEMWEAAQAVTSFDRYLFSHYKVYYSIETMLEAFADPAIWGVAVPTWSDHYIKSNLYRLQDAGKKIFVFTVTGEEEMAFAREVGAAGIYVDEVNGPKNSAATAVSEPE